MLELIASALISSSNPSAQLPAPVELSQAQTCRIHNTVVGYMRDSNGGFTVTVNVTPGNYPIERVGTDGWFTIRFGVNSVLVRNIRCGVG